MINPESIDIKTLPWLPLEQTSAFPKKSAVYFAIDSNEVIQYIGRSFDVKRRWNKHHKYECLSKLGKIKIAYLFISDKQSLINTEKALISWFKPPLNTLNKTPCNPTKKVKRFNKRKDVNYKQVVGYVHINVIETFRKHCIEKDLNVSEAMEEVLTNWNKKVKDD